MLASARAAAAKPYNSFVVLPDGHLVTKDFGGVLPGHDPATHEYEPAELLVLEPEQLEDRGPAARSPRRRSRGCRPTATPCTWSARRICTAASGTVGRSRLDDDFAVRYRTVDGPDLRLGLRDRARRGVVPRQRLRQRALRGHVPRPRREHGAAASRARRPRDRRGVAHRDLRATERRGGEPAARRRAPADRRRLRQRQRCARRVRHRRRRQPRRRAGGAIRTTRATCCSSPTPASS